LNSKNKKSIFREFLGYLIVAAIAALFAVLLRIFIIEPYIVPTPSMAPTLIVGDRVIVNKIAFRFSDIKRGDLIAFNSPFEEKYLVKRIIALPGDEISFTESGEIYINGEKLEEPYLPEDIYPSYRNESFILNEDNFFVMGDNRNNSSDSRVFGPIDKSAIFGEVILIYGPFSRIGRIH